MSVTLKGTSRGAGEGHVRTDGDELVAAFNYDGEASVYSLADPDSAFAYLWNLPCPEQDDRRWAGYTFTDPDPELEGNFSNGPGVPNVPLPVPEGAQNVGRQVKEWSLVSVVRHSMATYYRAVNNELFAAVNVHSSWKSQTRPSFVWELTEYAPEARLLPGDLNWTVSLAAYHRVQQLLGR